VKTGFFIVIKAFIVCYVILSTGDEFTAGRRAPQVERAPTGTQRGAQPGGRLSQSKRAAAA